MLPLMQKPSLRLLTWKADTGGWWDTCEQRGALGWPGGGESLAPSAPWRGATPTLTPAARGSRHGVVGQVAICSAPGEREAPHHPPPPTPHPRKHFLLSQRWACVSWGNPQNASRAQTPPTVEPSVQVGMGRACLLRDVEGVAVGLGVEPAAAEGLSQDGVVGLLDPLQATSGKLL